MSQVKEIIREKGQQGWDVLWKQQITPWDLGSPTPALVDLIQDTNYVPRMGDVLVPGCGNGYDVALLGGNHPDHPFNSSLRVTGMDISEEAVGKARKLMQEKGFHRVQFINGDFFHTASKYDGIFDYTFLCALHPSMRLQWASKMAQLIKPNGVLIALMFPLNSEKDALDGPPFPLSVEIYHALLDEAFDLVYAKEDCRSVESRNGHEMMTVWKRKGQ